MSLQEFTLKRNGKIVSYEYSYNGSFSQQQIDLMRSYRKYKKNSNVGLKLELFNSNGILIMYYDYKQNMFINLHNKW